MTYCERRYFRAHKFSHISEFREDLFSRCFLILLPLCSNIKVIFTMYIFARIFAKCENMYSAKISTFTVYLLECDLSGHTIRPCCIIMIKLNDLYLLECDLSRHTITPCCIIIILNDLYLLECDLSRHTITACCIIIIPNDLYLLERDISRHTITACCIIIIPDDLNLLERDLSGHTIMACCIIIIPNDLYLLDRDLSGHTITVCITILNACFTYSHISYDRLPRVICNNLMTLKVEINFMSWPDWLYVYSYFSFEYFDSLDHYTAFWFPLK